MPSGQQHSGRQLISRRCCACRRRLCFRSPAVQLSVLADLCRCNLLLGTCNLINFPLGFCILHLNDWILDFPTCILQFYIWDSNSRLLACNLQLGAALRSLSFQLAQLLLRHFAKLIVLGKRPESTEGATKELSTLFKTKAFLVLDLDSVLKLNLDLDLDDGIYWLSNEARGGEVEAGCREGDFYLQFLTLSGLFYNVSSNQPFSVLDSWRPCLATIVYPLVICNTNEYRCLI